MAKKYLTNKDMEKRYYKMPEVQVIDLTCEKILAGSETDGEESGGHGGSGDDEYGDAKRTSILNWD